MDKRDIVSSALLILLFVAALYRYAVTKPLWIDVYLLYLPALAFLVPLSIIVLCTRKAIGSLVCLAVATSLVLGFMIPFRSENPDERIPGLRLISLNIRSKSTDLTYATSSLMKLRPDFICLQELGRHADLELFEELATGYRLEGYAYHDEIKRNTFPEATFVAVRDDWKVLDFQWFDGGTVVEVAHGKERLVVVSLHGKRNKGFTPGAMVDTAKQQSEQVRQLLEKLSAYEAPVIIAGDFNAPDTGPAVKMLAPKYRLAFPEAGRGLELTFPGDFPLARIDHVLGSEEILFSNLFSKDFGSDHFGLVADFQLE